MVKKVITLVFLLFILTSCLNNDENINDKEYKITNIMIFEDSPAWELALAVKNQKIRTIKKIAINNPELLDYQDTKYGVTILMWAVGTEKYKSTKALLECGANPNIQSYRYETTGYVAGENTAVAISAGFSWIDRQAKKDPKYVKILLKYGVDPDWSYVGSEYGIEPGTSILMNSIGCGIEKTKALVEAGADINHKTISGETAAIIALDNSDPEYAYYLIVEKKANVSDPYFRRKTLGNEDPNEKLYPVRSLRLWWLYKLDSKEYRMKMEIVEEFKRQGVDYWDTEIPERTLEQIKYIYPDTWEEYIKKY